MFSCIPTGTHVIQDDENSADSKSVNCCTIVATLSCSHRVCKLLPFVVVGKCSVVNVAGNNKLLIATTEPHIKFQ